MAQAIVRKPLKVFGGSGGSSNFGQFGSQAASAPLETKDITTIQALTAWVDGWQDAVALGQAPYLQDMNGVMYVHSYELAYTLTEGIPEWDSATTYSKGCVVKLPYTGSNNYQIFVSLVDANLNNALPTAPASNSNWQFVQGFVSGVFRMGTGLGFGDYSSQGIIGTATNDDAAAGYVGQRLVSTVLQASSVTGTNSTYSDLMSLSLTPGDWDVTLLLCWKPNGSTGDTNILFGVSSTSGNSSTGLSFGDNAAIALVNTANTAQDCRSIPNIQIKVASTTTYYFKVNPVFISASPSMYGRMSARRER